METIRISFRAFDEKTVKLQKAVGFQKILALSRLRVLLFVKNFPSFVEMERDEIETSTSE